MSPFGASEGSKAEEKEHSSSPSLPFPSWRPVDDLHSDVERAWDRWKLSTHDLYPEAAAETIEHLLNESESAVLDIGAGRQALWLIAIANR